MAKRAPGDAAHTAFVGVEFARSLGLPHRLPCPPRGHLPTSGPREGGSKMARVALQDAGIAAGYLRLRSFQKPRSTSSPRLSRYSDRTNPLTISVKLAPGSSCKFRAHRS